MGPIGMSGLSAGLDAAAQVGQFISTASINKKTRQWNEMMYNKQRQDALTDWNMQNAYNAPTAQMSRFKAAGLNPNLIYGQMTDSPSIRSSSVESWHPQVPDWSGVGQIGHALVMDSQDLQLKQAQTDNLKSALETMDHQRALIDAQIQSTLAGIPVKDVNYRSKEFQLGMQQALAPTSLEMADTNLKLGLQKLINQQKTGGYIDARTKVMLDQNDRAAVMQAMNLKKGQMTLQLGLQSILNSRMSRAKSAQEQNYIQNKIQLLDKDQRIREAQAKMWEKGINPGDWMWWRELQQVGAPYMDASDSTGVNPGSPFRK